ncbi:MAG TPA: anhydro-N-acetylmuramic acid kinase [Gemmatimonadaceae bacterium]|nr:anhydro-N-acetylmuramic acid kinase [Gemmatimonadaceae bacterium]
MIARREEVPNAAARGGSPRIADVVVGLMSGTSLDGVTAAVVRFGERDGRIATELLAWLTHPYTAGQRARLAEALTGATPAAYCRVNFDLGGWLADAAVAAIAEAGVARDEIAVIASHGQTVWHEPGHSTWQLGESAVIAERTGIDVVADFRVRDVAAGGQGAPLVPVADALLFADQARWRALQNIGGIGNVTVVPPDGDLRAVRAFDTGPGVAVIDALARLADPSLPYDVDGRLALAGHACEEVVSELLAAPYFAAEPPKSTGRELFSAAYAQSLDDRCAAARPGATPADVVATATLLTARSIADAYRRFLPEPVSDVLLSGGGARNPALVAAIRAELPDREVRLFSDVFFDGEAKEAVAFALLGWLHHRGRPGNVPGATGARGLRILGKRTPA